MARIFKTPFAAQGDKEVVPVAVQGDGSVSITQGFSYDYEREYEDPASKDIRREVLNGLLHDSTEAIGELQQFGFSAWQADLDGGWALGAIVRHSDKVWQSLANANTEEPGAGALWKEIWFDKLPAASATAPGITRYATNTEALAQELGSVALTPANLSALAATAARQGLVKLASGTEVAAGEDTGKVVTPQTLLARTSTEARIGLVELASDIEAIAGTDASRAMTPRGAAILISNRIGMATFTASTNWTVPPGVTRIFVSGCAGGGGGGAGAGYVPDRQFPGGGGGAGESVVDFPITVVPGETLTITVPLGGTGGLGQAAGQAGAGGNSGGNASVYRHSTGTYPINLSGGSGGGGGSTAGGGHGGNGYPRGGYAMTGYGPIAALVLSGSGASSPFGGGGGGASSASYQIIGADARNYGAGGAGGNGLTANLSGPNGGAGSNGFFHFSW